MKSIAYVLQGLLYVLYGALVVVYGVDIIHDIVVGRRFLMLLVLFLLYPLLMAVLGGATHAASGLLAGLGPLIGSEEGAVLRTVAAERVPPEGLAAAQRSLRALALRKVPLGLGGGFLLWQAVSWLLFGLLDFEPWLYRIVFGRVDLTV